MQESELACEASSDVYMHVDDVELVDARAEQSDRSRVIVSQIWAAFMIIPSNFSISLITESFPKPTTKEVLCVISTTLAYILLSIEWPPRGWRDFALFESILEPSPAANMTV